MENNGTDVLADNLRRAQDTHADVLSRNGTPSEIMSAYRASIVAEIALLRDCEGPAGQAAADELTFLLEDLDAESAQ